MARRFEAPHVDLDARLGKLHQVAWTLRRVAWCVARAPSTGPPAPSPPPTSTTSPSKRQRGSRAGEKGCTDEELMSNLVTFRGSRSDTENLTSLHAQLDPLNPTEFPAGPPPAAD
jgi:hypothetical protein